MQHVNLGKRAPKSYEALMALSAQTEADAVAAGLDKKLVELVKIRSSQLNGCAFCLRMHVRDAVAAGETADRLAVVAAWWESQYFTFAEQAALLIAEDVTGISDQHATRRPEADPTALSEQQAAAVAWVAVAINAWNRVSIVSHYPVAP
ncbi:MAG: alkylhydroperoxidase [Microbacterium sp.]|jgi:AhpD family alkylhydroperoxidase|uniref:carboxymuconolactone decarboxylase family protein n=1 Tax=Curtobacterium flaccumfaciens TaxID=2035 RepID=UPI001BDF4C95|nr:carboxymuconolactone decarboxylase family protein [Curtobacterium flaccumfaciens]MBT1669158.1 carboxymuconolactone decarboxylase family protein [Curtobacterium flaccumfaciens pv. flaccumfaciens]MDF2989648.1 alkylhydroperoxidase [Microbacterium sp.]